MAGMIEGTLRHAQFYRRHIKNGDIQLATVAILLELGVPTKGAGFDYLKNAIIMFYDNPAQSITKELYPNVGKLYEPKVGYKVIEIAIRRAISTAWYNRNEKVWQYYFFPNGEGDLKKPSNAEFISMIAYFLELLQGCKEGSYERT